jgi:hypothetical protein
MCAYCVHVCSDDDAAGDADESDDDVADVSAHALDLFESGMNQQVSVCLWVRTRSRFVASQVDKKRRLMSAYVDDDERVLARASVRCALCVGCVCYMLLTVSCVLRTVRCLTCAFHSTRRHCSPARWACRARWRSVTSCACSW